MNKGLFIIIQWIWGFPQSLIGAIIYLGCRIRKRRHFPYKNASASEWKAGGGLSLGMFIFVAEGFSDRLIKHEYGHCKQSLILGPLYLILVGIPSIIWSRVPVVSKTWKKEEKSYFDMPVEKWADALGEVGHTHHNEDREMAG